MGCNVARKLIESHLVEGEMIAGREIGIRIDQTLTLCRTFTASHTLSERQIEVLFAGGLIRWVRARLAPARDPSARGSGQV